MANLLRMDLYRMRKAKSFWVCLILAFLFGFAQTPFFKLMEMLAKLLDSGVKSAAVSSVDLSSIIRDPLPFMNAMLALLSASAFFYADAENGYIKNIAGQMPKKGYTVLSKFLAVMPHNLLFMLAGIVGNLIGTLIFMRISIDSSIPEGIGIFFLRFLLLLSLCAILLLCTGCFRNKSLGTVLSVLMGTGLLFLVYVGINSAVGKVLKNEDFSIVDYMPDQLLTADKPDLVISIVASVIVIALFLSLAIRIFDKKDVK